LIINYDLTIEFKFIPSIFFSLLVAIGRSQKPRTYRSRHAVVVRRLILAYLASHAATGWCPVVAIVCHQLVDISYLVRIVLIFAHHFHVLDLLKVLWVGICCEGQRILVL
jgi:hypothetical protein